MISCFIHKYTYFLCLQVEIIMDKLKKSGILGGYMGHVYTIEFQKRGLPHIHILIFINRQYCLQSPEQVDQVISAELPDPQTHPRLYRLVTKFMIHRPCGELNSSASCMQDRVCSKKYPRPFNTTTTISDGGYPTYRRRDNGWTFQMKSPITGSNEMIEIGNQWVVPYNPMLMLMLECHANLESCMSVKAFKYIHKYIYKGHDRITMAFGEQNNEVSQYLDARYVSTSEAVWRLLHFSMHSEKPTVVRLAVHCENEQNVVFTSDNLADVIARGPSQTTLTQWLAMNAKEADEEVRTGIVTRTSRDLLYQDYPQAYSWNNSTKKWSLRRQNMFAIGRLIFAHPTGKECFYLRLLLTVRRGCTSFVDIRTINGHTYDTFKDACRVLGLLEDDRE